MPSAGLIRPVLPGAPGPPNVVTITSGCVLGEVPRLQYHRRTRNENNKVPRDPTGPTISRRRCCRKLVLAAVPEDPSRE
jgi:hypothetical protein